MTQQSQFLTAIECEEAHRRFRGQLDPGPLGTEMVPLNEALGRILASPVIARHNVPGFDRSNFDGFAIRSRDVVGASEHQPVELELIGEKIPAGRQPDCSLEPGQAVSISTGGMVPRGANAICLVEHAELLDLAAESSAGNGRARRRVRISRSVFPGSGISFAGTDIAAGETVLRGGQKITSRETGVLAAIGETEVEVFRRPKVAVISTGDEIIPPGSPIRPGQVFDSNARIIADAVRELGGLPIEMGIAIDDLRELESRVAKALEVADVVLLSGGTSKGEGDLSYRVVSQFDDPGIVAHGVALKPGKPICLAVTRRRPVVILPGFPTSAIFTFHEFVAPVIRMMSGQAGDQAPTVQLAELATPVNSEIGRTEFLLVGLLKGVSSRGAEEVLKAYPMGKGSGSVTTFSRADGFITIDRHTEILPAGQSVQVQMIGDRDRAADLVVMGSHCQRLDEILNRLQERGVQVKFFAIGSQGGLHAARHGDCDLAGIHLYDPHTGQYNISFDDDQVEIHAGYSRVQGVVYRKSDDRWPALLKLEPRDLVPQLAADPRFLMINRNQGSGTRVLIDRLLADAEQKRPPGYEIQASNHHAVCAAVEHQRADWGIAIEPVARQHDLGFIPLEDEQFDFAIPRSRRESPAVQAFLKILEETTRQAVG